MNSRILSLNAGSSSLRFALFPRLNGSRKGVVRGMVDEIATSRTAMTMQSAEGETRRHDVQASDHAAAFQHVLAEIERQPHGNIDGIGHRVVHGGAQFRYPVLIDDAVLDEILALVPFAPLHQPVQVKLIETAREGFPSVPQVACFDTAIHHTLPEVAARFPMPKWLWAAGVRRYGFHGLSYEFVLNSDPEFRQGRTIIAHLGNGASLTAFQDGVSVDTTMGFTPTGGMMMGTRCGDLDPGVVLHLLRQDRMSADDLDRLVNYESGLKGVSCKTSDVRKLQELQDDPDARLALEMFCYLAAKQIGALAATLSGIDRLVFTGGIGENSAEVRASICSRLGFLGIEINPDDNHRHGPVISQPGSRCAVHIVATDEEQMIAKGTADVLDQLASSH